MLVAAERVSESLANVGGLLGSGLLGERSSGTMAPCWVLGSLSAAVVLPLALPLLSCCSSSSVVVSASAIFLSPQAELQRVNFCCASWSLWGFF